MRDVTLSIELTGTLRRICQRPLSGGGIVSRTVVSGRRRRCESHQTGVGCGAPYCLIERSDGYSVCRLDWRERTIVRNYCNSINIIVAMRQYTVRYNSTLQMMIVLNMLRLKRERERVCVCVCVCARLQVPLKLLQLPLVEFSAKHAAAVITAPVEELSYPSEQLYTASPPSD